MAAFASFITLPQRGLLNLVRDHLEIESYILELIINGRGCVFSQPFRPSLKHNQTKRSLPSYEGKLIKEILKRGVISLRIANCGFCISLRMFAIT